MQFQDIHIRDPFVVPVPEEKRYYLFGSDGKECWEGPAGGFNAYWSCDLKDWEGPLRVFRPPGDFWADTQFWAPEVHLYNGRYFMFASFKAQGVCRGSGILVSDKILGHYVPHSEGPVTPRDWECLDGTFYVDGRGQPWMVFCHEWVQVHNGRICAVKLGVDLKTAVGEPILLFQADQAPWVLKKPGQIDFVTDGPFLYRAQNNELLMLWSSFGAEGYAMGIARSLSGQITGPWQQDPSPLFAKDGGHGMLFRTFDGQLMTTLHHPNQTPNERPVFIPIHETNGQLRVH